MNAEVTKILLIIGYVLIFLYIFIVINLWFIFKKTGRKGYIALIPFYNMWQFFVISNLKGWFSIVPIANILMFYVALYHIAKMFNNNTKFAILNVILPIVIMPIIAFNKSLKYKGYIEEPLTEKKLYDKPVYKTSDNEILEELPEEEIVDYKKVKNIKIKNKKGNSPIIDYSKKNTNKEEELEILEF